MKLILRALTLILFFAFSISAQVFDWEWQNPKPTGADHNEALILSPTNYMLFGNGGAVSRSSDGGATWTVLYVDTLNSNFNSASFPTANIGYVAGSAGTIMKTTDGGITWVRQTTNTTQAVWGIFFVNAETGYAATGAGGVLKTTDGGTTWIAGTYGTSTNYCFSFINATTGFLGSSSSTTGRLIKTTDAGATWTDVSTLLSGNTGAVRCISFLNSTTGVLSTASGLIYKTTDAGLTWTQVYSIGSTTTVIYKVQMTDLQNIIAATTLGRIVRSTDGGTTWSIVQLTTQKGLYSLGALGSNCVTAGDAGTIFTSTDNGATFVKRTNAPTQEQLQRAHFPSSTVGYVVGGSITTGNSFGDVLKTTDGGATWVKTPFTSSTRVYSVYFLNENVGFVGVEGPNGLYKTTDGGNTWTALSTGTGVSTSTIYDIDVLEGGLGFAAYGSGQLAKTTDGGNTWSPISAGFGSAACYDVFMVNPSVIYALGPGGRISKSVDGGLTFAQLPSLGTTTLYSMHFFSPDTGFVVGSGRVLKTTDGGGTFTDVTSTITTTIYTIRFLNRQIGWLGASGGDVYYTIDGGATWIKSKIPLGSSQTTRDIQLKDGILWLVGTDGMIMRGYANPLIPVELASFTATVTGNDVTLNWSTATETNNKGFEVQRLSAGNWKPIGFVNGKGTSSETSRYEFTDPNLPDGKFSYRLIQFDFNGESTVYNLSTEVLINSVTAFDLGQNYPNPFNPSTKIKYNLPVNCFVTLKVFDLLGREVAKLVNNEQAPGNYEVVFDVGRDAIPPVSTGIYFYRLTAGDNVVITKKMAFIK